MTRNTTLNRSSPIITRSPPKMETLRRKSSSRAAYQNEYQMTLSHNTGLVFNTSDAFRDLE